MSTTLRAEIRRVADHVRRTEFREGVTAFLEKRRADFVSAASTIGEPAA